MNRAQDENGTSPIQGPTGPTGLPASRPTADVQARPPRSREDEDGPKARVIAVPAREHIFPQVVRA
jgi:hypothetical protein